MSRSNETADEGAPNAASRMMILPTEAQKRLETEAMDNKRLHHLLESQNHVIGDITETLQLASEIQKKISEKDAELASTTQQLNDANYVLLNTLLNQPKKGGDVGNFLRAILDKFQNLLTETCSEALLKGSPSVSIMSVIDIEQQVMKIIEEMHGSNMYPESEKEAEERINAAEQHTQKILTFLKQIVGQPNERKAQQQQEQ